MRNFKKQNFIEITQNEFQKYSNSIITDYEAFEIQQNLFGIIELLINWSNKSKTDCDRNLAFKTHITSKNKKRK